ncbi:MAG: hypothetical protein PVF28_01025 [Thioalkalispiraceae bacterium]
MTAELDWQLPLANHDIKLHEAFDALQQARSSSINSKKIQVHKSLLDRLVIAGLPGLQDLSDIDQRLQDFIHILLGRGFHAMDESFVTGFTLGSIRKVTHTEQATNAFVAQHISPAVFELTEAEMTVFKDAIRLAFISNCSPLSQLTEFNLDDWLEQSVEVIRNAIDVEAELLVAYYAVEKRRNPHCLASQRLLPQEQQTVAF